MNAKVCHKLRMDLVDIKCCTTRTSSAVCLKVRGVANTLGREHFEVQNMFSVIDLFSR